ncbi:MAG TPA: hypothetical protein PLV45_16475, partial [bacterium]|nr:hypothetical protein [bacterium]
TGTWPPLPGIDLVLSGAIFHEGDLFELTAEVTNPGPDTYQNIPMVILLDAAGQFFWYPSWDMAFDYRAINVVNPSDISEILSFTWPQVNGSVMGIHVYGALLTPDFGAILGTWDTVTFGWE